MIPRQGISDLVSLSWCSSPISIQGGVHLAFVQAVSAFACAGHAVVGVARHAPQGGVLGCGVTVAGLVVLLTPSMRQQDLATKNHIFF